MIPTPNEMLIYLDEKCTDEEEKALRIKQYVSIMNERKVLVNFYADSEKIKSEVLKYPNPSTNEKPKKNSLLMLDIGKMHERTQMMYIFRTLRSQPDDWEVKIQFSNLKIEQSDINAFNNCLSPGFIPLWENPKQLVIEKIKTNSEKGENQMSQQNEPMVLSQVGKSTMSYFLLIEPQMSYHKF